MDYDDLKSSIRGAAMTVEELDRREVAPAEAKEFEIDLSLAGQELDDLDRQLDELRDEHEASDHVRSLDEPDFDELDRQIESARDQLRDASRRLDDLPDLAEVDQIDAGGPAAAPGAQGPELG
jgi:chromosome segregation ATPase